MFTSPEAGCALHSPPAVGGDFIGPHSKMFRHGVQHLLTTGLGTRRIHTDSHDVFPYGLLIEHGVEVDDAVDIG
jgi:hypothetical protein